MLYHHNDDLTPFTAQARERCATEFKGMSKNSVMWDPEKGASFEEVSLNGL